MGLVLASTFVLYRNANALSNLLEYPVWIASGLVFSTSLLPSWTRPISWLLPPYWGILALRHAALGGEVWLPLAFVTLLGLASRRRQRRHLPLVRARGARPRDPLADVRRWLSRLLRGRVDRLSRPLQLDPAGDVHPDDAREPALPADLLHEARPVRPRRRRRDFYIVGNSRAGLRDGVGLRNDDGDRERALVRDARPAARVAGEPRGRLPRARRAGARERAPRLGVHVRARAWRCSASGPGSARCRRSRRSSS